jgi:hypothetical protein
MIKLLLDYGSHGSRVAVVVDDLEVFTVVVVVD